MKKYVKFIIIFLVIITIIILGYFMVNYLLTSNSVTQGGTLDATNNTIKTNYNGKSKKTSIDLTVDNSANSDKIQYSIVSSSGKVLTHNEVAGKDIIKKTYLFKNVSSIRIIFIIKKPDSVDYNLQLTCKY